jgi:hypothetical protein
MIEQVERAQQHDLARQHYAQCTAPRARIRWLRLMAKQKDYQALLQPLTEAYQTPEDEAEAMALAKLLKRVRRHLPSTLVMKASPTPRPPIRQTVILQQGTRRVERAVSESLQTATQPVLWSENTLWNALFGLLFWPALFAPVAGAFFHPYQAAPADLYRPDFMAKRQSLIDQQWQAFAQPDYAEQLVARYGQYQGLSNAFIAWPALTLEQLDWALQCIPKTHLTLIFQRMMRDLKHHRSGFPDLIQFDLDRRSYQLYEVKGPGDRLQDHQLRWLCFFQDHNIPAQVIDVQWLSDSSV